MIFSDLLNFEQALSGKKILVTGHTGFTGSWVCLWLHSIGAKILGFSLLPETNPSLYTELGLDSKITSTIGDITDYHALSTLFEQFQPELVLHLAAQPLVRRSYAEPVSTFATNVIGTAHILEASRLTPTVKGVVCVTTDKVYKNHGWPWAYRENDALGGNDPYSASKAAAELVIQSYMASYGKLENSGLPIATARGGNIIGGGDWSEDRLIPDFVRAVTSGEKIKLRYPEAVRPWQHVLALSQGYLMLLSGLLSSPQKFARAWNMGPSESRSYTVNEVLEILFAQWQGTPIELLDNSLHESAVLTLDSSLARNLLGWVTPWDTRKVIAETANWYRDYYRQPANAQNITLSQLQEWREALSKVER